MEALIYTMAGTIAVVTLFGISYLLIFGRWEEKKSAKTTKLSDFYPEQDEDSD